MQEQAGKPTTVQQNHNRLSTASLILGISSIVLLGVGLFTGVAAIITGNKAKKANPTDSHAKIGIITGTIGLVLNVLGIAIAVGLSVLLYNVTPHDTRAYDTQIAQKKDFALGEKMIIGANEIAITKVETDYTPLPNELSEQSPDHIINDVLSARYGTDEYKTLKAAYDASELTNTNSEYVLIEGTVRIDESVKAPYAEDTSFLLNSYPVTFTTGAYNLWAPRPAKPNSTPPTSFHAVYKIKQGSSALVFAYRTSIYRFVSPIVGTEGAASTSLVYTLQLK